MEPGEIINKLTEIFKNELDNDSIVLSSETTANDIEEWDSLTNIQLIVAIEKFFKIRFTASEITGFKNVGELCIAIRKKATS